MIGETFFHLSTDEVNEELNSAKDATRMRMTELDELISESKAKMQTLKRELYAKFGTHINLEED